LEHLSVPKHLFSGINENQKGDNHAISCELRHLKDYELSQTHPLFHKALKFYNISLDEIRTSYKYVDYSRSSHGSN